MRKLWMRVGMCVEITEEEESILFSDDSKDGAEVIKRIIHEGRTVLDGETYVPEPAVEDFNAIYGTNHEVKEWSWDL